MKALIGLSVLCPGCRGVMYRNSIPDHDKEVISCVGNTHCKLKNVLFDAPTIDLVESVQVQVTVWRHPSSDQPLILAGTGEENCVEARQYFTRDPEKLVGEERMMGQHEFTSLPEFNG